MAFETINGRRLRTGGFVPASAIKAGQIWTDLSKDVQVIFVDESSVTYEGEYVKPTTEDSFLFQCRFYEVWNDVF